jgi:hypothetical protein
MLIDLRYPLNPNGIAIITFFNALYSSIFFLFDLSSSTSFIDKNSILSFLMCIFCFGSISCSTINLEFNTLLSIFIISPLYGDALTGDILWASSYGSGLFSVIGSKGMILLVWGFLLSSLTISSSFSSSPFFYSLLLLSYYYFILEGFILKLTPPESD